MPSQSTANPDGTYTNSSGVTFSGSGGALIPTASTAPAYSSGSSFSASAPIDIGALANTPQLNLPSYTSPMQPSITLPPAPDFGVTAAKSDVQGTLNDIGAVEGALGEKSVVNNNLVGQYITPLNQDLMELYNKDTQYQSDLSTIQSQALQANNTSEDRLAPMFAIQGEQAQIQRQSENAQQNINIQRATNAAVIAAKQNQLSLANDYVTRALSSQFDPLNSQLDYLKQVLSVNQDTFSNAEKEQLQSQIDNYQSQIQQQQTNKTEIYNIMTTAAQNGADNATLANIAQAQTPGEAWSLASGYGMSPLTAAEINMYNSYAGSSGGAPIGGGTGSTLSSAQLGGPMNSGVTAADGGTFASFPSTLAAYNYAGTLISQIANGQNSIYGQNPTLQSFADTWTNTKGTAAANIAKSLGVDANTPLSQVVAKQGLPTLLNALAQNEGGSYQGVQNNPFNIKYTGDQHQPAAATPEQVPFSQYGTLSKTDFNPNNPDDQAALTYLRLYFNNGQIPTPGNLGISTRSASGVPLPMGMIQFSKISQRANDLYGQATGGQGLPGNVAANRSIVTNNNNLLNSLKVQDQTIQRNFGLSLQNLDENNINQALPIINSITNAFNTAMGDPATSAYIGQNSTIQNELGSLLAVKNAQGTTVHDKLASAGLIPEDAPASVQVAVVKQLLLEAQNAQSVLTGINGDLYKQVDPLMLDSNNPNRTTEANSQQVNDLLSKQGLDYNTVAAHLSQLAASNPQQYAGMVPAIDTSSGQVGFATQDEISNGTVLPL